MRGFILKETPKSRADTSSTDLFRQQRPRTVIMRDHGPTAELREPNGATHGLSGCWPAACLGANSRPDSQQTCRGRPRCSPGSAWPHLGAPPRCPSEQLERKPQRPKWHFSRAIVNRGEMGLWSGLPGGPGCRLGLGRAGGQAAVTVVRFSRGSPERPAGAG